MKKRYLLIGALFFIAAPFAHAASPAITPNYYTSNTGSWAVTGLSGTGYVVCYNATTGAFIAYGSATNGSGTSLSSIMNSNLCGNPLTSSISSHVNFGFVSFPSGHSSSVITCLSSNYATCQSQSGVDGVFQLLYGSPAPPTPTYPSLSFLGSTTPAELAASVTSGTQATGADLWPLLLFIGIPLGFAIAGMVIALVMAAAGARSKKKQ